MLIIINNNIIWDKNLFTAFATSTNNTQQEKRVSMIGYNQAVNLVVGLFFSFSPYYQFSIFSLKEGNFT